MQLQISAHRDGGRRIVTAAGSVDLSNADLLRRHVAAELHDRPDEVVVDLTAVTFIDAIGAQAIQDLQRHAAARGVAMRVRTTDSAAPLLSA